MKVEILQVEPKLIIGKKMRMSLANNQTHLLWHTFMKEKASIANVLGNNLYSIELYPSLYFEEFNQQTEFEKWAGAEVQNFKDLPKNFESILLPGGLYALFIHKGKAINGHLSFNYIFNTWLPNSGYIIDYRPHYEVMSEKYQQNNDDSEEELFIPIKPI